MPPVKRQDEFIDASLELDRDQIIEATRKVAEDKTLASLINLTLVMQKTGEQARRALRRHTDCYHMSARPLLKTAKTALREVSQLSTADTQNTEIADARAVCIEHIQKWTAVIAEEVSRTQPRKVRGSGKRGKLAS